MSSIIPPITPANVDDVVKADKKRPYKAYAGMAVALIGLVWANLEGRDNLDNMTVMEWLSIIIPALLTFGAIYGVENPKVVVNPTRDRGEAGAADIALVLIVIGVVMAIAALLVAKLAFLLWIGIVLAVVGVILMVTASSRAR